MRKYYIGIERLTGDYVGFGATEEPTAEEYGPLYTAVIGPFVTRRAQLWAVKYGKNNPHFQHVNDAERLSKQD